MLTADRLVAAPGATLADATLADFIVGGLSRAGLEGSTVLLVVPDATRTMPLPLVLRAVHAALNGRVRRLSVVVALGTHRPLREDELDVHLGVARDGWRRSFRG
jgi:nickel-dependent lactate racemase